jgi:hypothetical protein
MGKHTSILKVSPEKLIWGIALPLKKRFLPNRHGQSSIAPNPEPLKIVRK